MTAAQTEYEFHVPEKRADLPTLKFKINDEPFVMLMPKLTVAVGLLTVLEREDHVSRIEYGLELARAMWGLIDYVETEDPEPMTIPNPEWTPESPSIVPENIANPDRGKLHGRARLQQRLNDPRDGLDVDGLAPVLGRMLSVMFNRPTITPPESSSQPSGVGSDSSGDTPVTLAETSST